MSTNQILVTGSTGNVGRELVGRLAEAGADFDVMSRTDVEIHGARVRRGAFDDADSLTDAFRGVDTLFVLLPLVPEKLVLARNVAAAAQAAGVRHIVRSSGAGADPASPYALLRLQGEIDSTLSRTGIPTTFIRPASFMQNLTGYQASSIRSGALYAGLGDGAQSLIDVRDIADAAATVLRSPAAHAGKAYTLTGPTAYTAVQILAVIAAATGKPVTYVDVPEAAARAAMLGLGMPEIVVEWLLSLNQFIKHGGAAGITGDVRELTGRAARSLEAFADEHAAQWR